MPRIARVAGDGMVQHVLNRGNGRMKLFHKPVDYHAFVDLLGEALDRIKGMRLLGWCLMPNHWHMARWPSEDQDLSAGDHQFDERLREESHLPLVGAGRLS